MTSSLVRRCAVALLLGLCGFARADGACPAGAQPSEPRELANLRAFARLYGVLRFFHPSDEAAAVDWNRYAVLGVTRVRASRSTGELESALESLVRPIAPTVQILRAGEAAAGTLPDSGDELVAWQHFGPGFDGRGGTYRSKRTGRRAEVSAGDAGWTSVTQSIDAAPHRGKRFRLHAVVRAAPGARVGAWARVYRADGGVGFDDDTGGRMVTADAWSDAVVEGVIDADAERLVIGGWATGPGAAWFDDFTLTIDDETIPLSNPGFESGTTGWGGGLEEAGGGEDRYAFEVVPAAHGGAMALRVAPRVTVLTEDLFEERAAAGEVAEFSLCDGLVARVPIALWSRAGHTLPASDPSEINAALANLSVTLADADARLADLVVAWSVFDQFYPYFDVVSADWPAVLDRTLRDGLDDADALDHERTLTRLVAALEDGHGSASVQVRELASLPLRLAWAEGQVVVTASVAPDLARGDVVEKIDGVRADELLDAEMEAHSGSPQWRRVRALEALGSRPAGESAALRIRRGDAVVEATVVAGTPPAGEFALPAIARLDEGIWYFDLARAEPDDVSANIAALADAPGVVFDVRARPNGTHAVLQHLLSRAEHDEWMHVARIVRPSLPGSPRPAHGWDSFGWDLVPAEPRIAGRVVFLTGSGAISYAESVMGYVEALGLDIVGGATAGANGDIRRVALPTGSRVTFTGRKVTRHDGSPSHNTGIHPTIAVEPTVAGIRAGRDEVLERALQALRQKPDR